MKMLALMVIVPSTKSHNTLIVSKEHDPSHTIKVECYAESVLLEMLDCPSLNVITQDYGYEELRTYDPVTDLLQGHNSSWISAFAHSPSRVNVMQLSRDGNADIINSSHKFYRALPKDVMNVLLTISGFLDLTNTSSSGSQYSRYTDTLCYQLQDMVNPLISSPIVKPFTCAYTCLASSLARGVGHAWNNNDDEHEQHK